MAIAEKFQDPMVTLDGSARAHVAFAGLKTLWVNTGTLCNIECANCYIDSSPKNDALAYIRLAELAPYLAEAADMGAEEIGFTGGEPFMNPDMLAMTEASLEAGFEVLILTNAMRPMQRPLIKEGLLELQARFGGRLTLRVSLDHYAREIHDGERGAKSFDAAMEGLAWLSAAGFAISAAGRVGFGVSDEEMRKGFAALFARHDVSIDVSDPAALVLFPEMAAREDVPEITTECWGILNKSPSEMMCADARMLVKRKGAAPSVLACTLIAYDERFDLGASLGAAARPVSLNHSFCAEFCVLGGARCSG